MRLSLVVILVVALLATAFLPAAAQTAAPVQLAGWDVQVWPEYDQPSVLVILNGTIADGAAYPVSVQIPLPAEAEIHAVAYPDATGNLLTLAADTQATADGKTVSFELDQPKFVIEFYADILTPAPDRSFALNLVTPYATQQATLMLRQPARASNWKSSPAIASNAVDELGNPTYTLNLGAQTAGQTFPVQVSYTKADANPSVAAQAQTPATTNAVVAAEPVQQNWLPWLAALAALAGAGALLAYVFSQRRAAATMSRQARRRTARERTQDGNTRPSPQPKVTAAVGTQNKFCSQCGQKFADSDKFCRNCGAPRP